MLLYIVFPYSLGAAQGYRYTQEVVTLWYRAPELLLGETDYSTAIDVWSMGCIFGEIIGRKPLFPGEGESDQVSKIAKLLGAPSESNWPEFSKLPNATKFNWTAYPKSSKLRDRFPPRSFTGGPCIDDSGFSLLTSMLAWSPILRITAAAASKHPWFVSELPKATPLELMPTFLSRHEKEEHDA
jgi:cell division cycle 2-like protein